MAKLMTKKGDLEKQMEKLSEKRAKSDYKEKVPVKVQEQDAEKVGKGALLGVYWGGGCESSFNISSFFFFTATAEPNRT